MRKLTNAFVGIGKKRTSRVSGGGTPEYLLQIQHMDYAVFYFNGKVFELRVGIKHIGLVADQLSFEIEFLHDVDMGNLYRTSVNKHRED